MNPRPTYNKRKRNRRRGLATTEFAICMPILLLFIFGVIEACNMIYLKQSLSVAAYEGARVAINKDIVKLNVETAAGDILTERNINGGSVDIIPDVTTVVAGDYITIAVSAPAGANSFFQGWFFNNDTITGEATMMKEY